MLSELVSISNITTIPQSNRYPDDHHWVKAIIQLSSYTFEEVRDWYDREGCYLIPATGTEELMLQQIHDYSDTWDG